MLIIDSFAIFVKHHLPTELATKPLSLKCRIRHFFDRLRFPFHRASASTCQRQVSLSDRGSSCFYRVGLQRRKTRSLHQSSLQLCRVLLPKNRAQQEHVAIRLRGRARRRVSANLSGYPCLPNPSLPVFFGNVLQNRKKAHHHVPLLLCRAAPDKNIVCGVIDGKKLRPKPTQHLRFQFSRPVIESG